MTPALIAALLCALPGQSAALPQVDPALIRVYVGTNPGGLGELEQSVKDLTSAIASKKKLMAIVDDEDKADVVIVVKHRGTTVPKIVIGIGPRPGQGADPAATSPAREALLTVDLGLAHADEKLEIKNKNRANDNPGGWKSAAEDIAKQVEKWVSDRRAKIVSVRPKTP